MVAVLMLAGSSAVQMSGAVMVGLVMLAAALGAVGQWAASATWAQRRRAAAVGLALTAMVCITWDCGGMWEWLCYYPLW